MKISAIPDSVCNFRARLDVEIFMTFIWNLMSPVNGNNPSVFQVNGINQFGEGTVATVQIL